MVIKMDKYGIDSHKLHYHLSRVAAWQNGENIYPIYMEISPSGMCNHRCTFCALDFMEYQKRFLDSSLMAERLAEMGRLGLKSVMFAGEGEPLLHKEIVAMTRAAREAGIDTAFTTNGVLLSPEKSAALLPLTEWIKVSINAGTPQTYAAIHRTKAADFDRVIGNLAAAARLRAQSGATCVLGMQLLLLPENRGEVRDLAVIAREIGMDYLVVKPYSQHPASRTEAYREVRYDDYEALCEELAPLGTDTFQVIVRTATIHRWNDKARGYDRCLALPFWSYVDAGGNVWGCSMFLGDERFRYGNLHTQGFAEIWEGERRRQSLAFVASELDAATCRVNCRMDKINQYLWNLRHPPAHVNFI